ncbi:hypothetical protein [Halobellus sp. GM3]|uniref:hypothetical protein n=1 Tax=Halobellus sp. GM3 TaxID=3458410 RepID=UPI00403DFDCC
MRYRLALLIVTIVTAGVVGSAFLGSGGAEAGERPPAEQLLRPSEAESFVWPYTSRSHTTEGRTLALNVIVVGSPGEVRAALTDRSELAWETAESDRGVDDNATLAENITVSENVTLGENVTFSAWNPARGAARYTYVADNASSGQWVHSEYQLATGTYLGGRTHIRAYPGPSDNWTALQAHTEYWDWYRLRHTVTGVSEGARVVEGDLRDEPFVVGVSRVYHGHRGGGSDGWMTVIELSSAIRRASGTSSLGVPGGLPASGASVVPAAALLAIAVSPFRRRVPVRDAALPLAMVALVLGVRSVGIAAESLFPAANPKVFAAMLYPVLVAGPPAIAAQIVHDRSTKHAGLLAAVGLGAGFVLDLGGLGVNVVPIDLVLQRTALIAALGLFTHGVARGDRTAAGVGLAVWLIVLAASLLGLL